MRILSHGQTQYFKQARFRCLFFLLAGISIITSASQADEPARSSMTPISSSTSRGVTMNGKTTNTGAFLRIDTENNRIKSLLADATGKSHFGMDLIAGGGSAGPVVTTEVTDNKAVFHVEGDRFEWDLPFDSQGYYDADIHVNYPSPLSTQGAYPLVLPVRKIVTSSGQSAYIEHFKRLEEGKPYFLNLNLKNGSQFLLCGDVTQNYDLKVTWPGQDWIEYTVERDKLRLIGSTTTGPITVEVLPRGLEEVPDNALIYPTVKFDPDFLVKCDVTGKQVSASALATDLMRMGIYWAPRVTAGGEWGLAAIETHRMNDPRSWHLHAVREAILKEVGLVGYDRFEHFGLKFAWGHLPDYGAGGLLNTPPSNAPFDMRMLHLSGQWVQGVASYVLATGDVDLLRARRARWISTDGDEPQPICGKPDKSASEDVLVGLVPDFVLAAGDVRLDGKESSVAHSLGQTFKTVSPFRSISLRMGTDSKKEIPKGVAVIRNRFNGDEIFRTPFSLKPDNKDQQLTITLPRRFEAGTYYISITDDASGKQYFSPGMFWWTDPETKYIGGDATSGPFQGNVFDMLVVMLDYMRKYMGAEEEDLAYFKNDPQYNVPDHRSGRHAVSTGNSYWELPGGGYDAFVGIWYNAGCKQLAELCRLLGKTELEQKYRQYSKRADNAYNQKYWYTVTENGQQYSRYYACEDWDGNIHDYGMTYYNLEAASRGISRPEQARDIIWWLDRGKWSPDGGPFSNLITDWRKYIYSPWKIAPPFNTIGNTTWLNVTGILPYFEVVGNGGTRLDIAAHDIKVRAREISVDNMHERNMQILSRFARPDRLTGGRTFNDPGGRGRWHFGEPANDKADIEGFREIFPINGVLATAQPTAYLGMEFTGSGLLLRPRVPSELNSFSFDGIAYSGAVLDFKAEAIRDSVSTSSVDIISAHEFSFNAAGPFNKVGILPSVKPFNVRNNVQVSLTLERGVGDGRWEPITTTWYNHVQNANWLWITLEEELGTTETYRVRVHDIDTPEGEALSFKLFPESYNIRLVREQTRLTIHPRYNPLQRQYKLGNEGPAVDAGQSLSVVLGPGERTVLTSDVIK